MSEDLPRRAGARRLSYLPYIAAIAALTAIAAVSGGCGPSLIWSGHTADRRHTVEVIADGGVSYVVVDGQRRAGYRGVAVGSIALSEDGHLALAARTDRGWVVVRDGDAAAGEAWDDVGELALSPTGRLAYTARRAGGWHVVVDGRPGSRFDAIAPGTLRFGAGGRRVVYAGQARGRAQVVVDGAAGPAFDAVDQIELSADGAHVAYAARRGQGAHVVVDDRIGPRWSAVGKLALSPAGGRVAYAALDRAGWRVVLDGEPGPELGGVRRILFRDDGRHAAWIARVGERDVLFLDGAEVAAAPALRASAVAFRPAAAPGDGPGLVHVAPVRDGERVVQDGAPGATYHEIGTPVFGPDGRLAYAARRADGWVLALGGRELPGAPVDAVGDPVFSPDGSRLAYLARRGGVALAVVDGREHRFDLALEGSLAFSADGRRWAVIAGAPARERLFFAVEAEGGGVRRVPLTEAEVSSAAARHPAAPPPHPGLGPRAEDRERLRAWSRAQADRAARP